MDKCTQLVNDFKKITVMLLMVLLVAGCSNKVLKSWTITQQNDKVIWADDGSQVAIVILSFEENPGSFLGGTTDKRNFKHQIVVQNLDGSERQAITKWRDHQNGQLFFMKQAGYLVVESLLANGARRFDKVSENGNEILIIETPNNEHQPCRDRESSSPPQVHHTVIPSPDGLQLAHIYSPTCGKVTIEFSHANNLNLFDGQTMDIDEPMTAMWHPDGYVILATNNNDKAWKVTPLATPLPISPPNCMSPVTTSSEVSMEGQKVYFDGDKLATKDVGSQKAFGCI